MPKSTLKYGSTGLEVSLPDVGIGIDQMPML